MFRSTLPLTFIEISLVLVRKFSFSLVLSTHQISYILISISISESTKSCDGIFFEYAVILKFARMNKVAFSIFLIIFEFSLVCITIRVGLFSISIFHVILPISFIVQSFPIIIRSISLFYIILPGSYVDLSIISFPNSKPISLFISVISFIILITLLHNFKTKSITFVIFPVTNEYGLFAFQISSILTEIVCPVPPIFTLGFSQNTISFSILITIGFTFVNISILICDLNFLQVIDDQNRVEIVQQFHFFDYLTDSQLVVGAIFHILHQSFQILFVLCLLRKKNCKQ